MAEKVNLTLHEGEVKVEPGQYLGSTFGRYLDACRQAGAIYRPAIKAQIVRIEGTAQVIESLRLAGFSPVVSTELAQRIKSDADRQQEQIDKAQDRVKAINEALAKRNLKLFPFQETGVGWLAPRERALLADEMGLGKTIQALVSIPTDSPVVVIPPAAVKGVWLRECQKWRPDLKPKVLRGRGSFRWPGPGEMFIINYDILPDDVSISENGQPALFDVGFPTCQKGTVLIPDEAHSLKNSKTKRTKRFRELSKTVLQNEGKVWLLTGTPLLNRPQELWNVLLAADLARDAFGTFPQFCRVMGGRSGAFGMVWDGQTTPEAPELLKKVMLYRKREEVLPDLPTKIWEDIEVPLDVATEKLCDDFQKEYGVDLLHARRVAESGNGAIAFEAISKVRAAVATSKIAPLVEIVKTYEDAEEPVVVFCDHKAPGKVLEQRDGWAKIDGDTPPEKRTELVDAFQGGRLKGLAVTIVAGGVGLTLTKAHQCVFVNLNWTPALNKQAEDRLCRIGQTRGVVVKRLVADHEIDRPLTQVLAEKQALLEATVEKAAVRDPAKEDPRRGVKALEGAQVSDAPAPARGKPRREAKDDTERWAMKGLVHVAALDPDHASAINGVGFSKLDGKFGHSMAAQAKSGRLTEKQWAAVVRLAVKYRRQIPEDPPVPAA